MREALIALLIGLIGHALAGEFETWAPRLADKLVRAAVRLLPAARRSRMISEWRAHLAETSLSHRKLMVSMGLVFGGVRIRLQDALARRLSASQSQPLPPNEIDSDAVERPAASPVKLTDRQRECLIWVAHGKSDSVIAQLLAIKPSTVNAHIEAAKRKYSVATRSQLLVRALRDGQLQYEEAIDTPLANDP